MAVYRCIAILCLLAVTVSAQDQNGLVNCYANDNCDGSPVQGDNITRDSCCNNLLEPVGFSVGTGLEECQMCPIVVGFSPDNFTGEEQGEGHTVMAGYLSGRPPRGGILSVELRLTGTAVAGDVDVTTRVRALSNVPLSPVTISLRVDGVAQEVNETFSLEFLDLPLDDVNFFPMGVPVTIGHLNGTILDQDSINFQLAEDDFIQQEEPNAMMEILILKDGIRLANPVRFKITPLTVDESEALGIVTNFPRPPNDDVSPSRADNADFNTTSFEVTLLPDENLTPGSTGRTVFIPIMDDEIDEAEMQFFITSLEIVDAVNLDLITISRTFSTCIIVDNDDTQIGYALPVYSFPEPDFETMIREVTLIRENGSLSEQTFTVAISVGDPGGTTQSATLESDDPLNSDYRIPSPNNFIPLRFPARADNITFFFFLKGDELPEGLEAFRATSTPFEGSPTFQSPLVGGAFATTEIRILDNDFATVGFVQPNYTISETGGLQQVCVQLFDPDENDELGFNIFLEYETRNGSADGSDYTEDKFLVAFLAAISNGMPRVECFDIFITDDQLHEDVESFTITLELDNTQSGVIIDPSVTTIFIEDNDEVTITFEEPVYTATELSGVAVVCLIKNPETADQIIIEDITTSPGTATAGDDYSPGPFSVTFGTGANDRQCINISLLADNLAEPTEDFTVSLNLPSAANPMVFPGTIASAVVNIIDSGNQLTVNDTVIGDPLFTVPILVPEEQLAALNLTRISLCYEIHGSSDQWFNLVTDECATVNAQYFSLIPSLNVIDEIGVRAVDDSNQCVNIRVNVNNCTAEVNDVPLDLMERYSSNGINIRRYNNRVRISVPNCNELTLVMWAICEMRTLENPDVPGTELTGKMIKYVVMRGLNFGHRAAHGLIGQFWNIPVEVTPFNGQLKDGSEAEGLLILNMTSLDKPRAYAGWLFPLTWEFDEGFCLYVGDRQAGRIYEVINPNDGVIENIYQEYKVDSAFSEENYIFGLFSEDRCGSGLPATTTVGPTTGLPATTTGAPTFPIS